MAINNLCKRLADEFRNTGERPVLNKKLEEIDPVLQFAYRLAASKMRGDASVLDYGCGGGYGTEYLSRFTKNLTVGFDTDAAIIKQNKIFFVDSTNVSFYSDPSELAHYDVIVLFQVIEHLSLEAICICLKKIQELMNKDGIIFFATVNKKRTSFNLKRPVMPFHVYEFTPTELSSLLKKYFHNVVCYGQIEEDRVEKIHAGTWNYLKDYDLGFRIKSLRFLSQLGLVRFVARRTPLFLKSFIFGYNCSKDKAPYFKLTQDPVEIENSYILIYECKK